MIMNAMKFNLKTAEDTLSGNSSIAEFLTNIRNESGCTESEYLLRYRQPIVQVAEYILDLPAAQSHHAEPGGALRFAVESAFFAMRISDVTMYTNTTSSEERRVKEPQYRYGAFIAALLSSIHLTVAKASVMSEDGELWSEAAGPLGPWLQSRRSKTYTFGWNAKAGDTNRLMAAYCTRPILDTCCLHLSPQIFRDLLGAIGPDEYPSGHESLLTRTVRESIQKAKEMDQRRNAANYTQAPVEIKADPALIASLSPDKPSIEPVTDVQDTQNVDAKKTGDAPTPSIEVMDKGETPNQLADSPSRQERPNENQKPAPEPAEAGTGWSAYPALDKTVLEILKMISADCREDEKVQKKLRWISTGLLISTELLGDYGLAQSTVVAGLRKAELIVKKEGNGLVVSPDFGSLIFTRPSE